MKVLLMSERAGNERMAVAVRLDKDIVTQGKDARQALNRLQSAIWGYEMWEEHDQLEGKPAREHGPAPEVYAKLYGLSAIWDGRAPSKDWEVRVWHGDCPFKWVKSP